MISWGHSGVRKGKTRISTAACTYCRCTMFFLKPNIEVLVALGGRLRGSPIVYFLATGWVVKMDSP